MAVKLIPPQQNNALGLLGSNNPFSSGSLLQGSRLDVDPNLQTRTSSFNSLAELERFNQENQPGARKNRFFKGLRDLGLALQGVNPTAYDVQQQQLLQAQEDENRRRQLIASLPEDIQRIYGVYGPDAAYKAQYGTAKAKPTSYQEYALTDDTPSSSEYEAFLNRPKGQTGKTIYQVVDGNDTFIQNISKEEALQKLPEFQQQGFKITALPSGTEPAQSTSQQLNKRLNPIINKYEGATNLINEFNVVAQRIYDTPEVANQLVAGGATAIKYLESNLEGFKNVISENKNNPIYKQFLDNPISIDTKSDFSQKISEISKGNALVKSRILDLAFVFAKARGQEGRGLSDRDFENSLNIISGGVNAEEKIATLEDAARAIASEYDTTIQVQKDLNASDVDYINKLNNIVKLPVFINPFTQVQPQSNNNQNDDVPRIRIPLKNL